MQLSSLFPHVLTLSVLSGCREIELIESDCHRDYILCLNPLSLNVALFLLSSNSAKSSVQTASHGVTRLAGLIAAICGCGAVLQCQRHLKYYPERFFLPVNRPLGEHFSATDDGSECENICGVL